MDSHYDYLSWSLPHTPSAPPPRKKNFWAKYVHLPCFVSPVWDVAKTQRKKIQEKYV